MALGVTPTGVVASRGCRAATDRTLKTSCAFLNERAWLCCPGGGGGGGEHNSGACCHGNPGQLMHHQSQNKSFSVFAASDFSPLPCYNQVVSLSSVCHTAAFPKAWEDNRTFKENGAVWAEIREWAGGGKEEAHGRPRRGLQAELCGSWGLRKTLTLLRGENSGRRAQFPLSSAGIEPGNGHLSQQCVRGQWKRRATVHPARAMTIPQHFTSNPAF